MHLRARYHYILTREPKLKTTLVEFVFKCSVEVHLRIDRPKCPKCPKKRCLSDVVFDRRELLRQERYQQTNKNTPGEWSEIHDSGSAFANSKN